MPRENSPRPNLQSDKTTESARSFAEPDETAESRAESESVGRMMQEVGVRLGPSLQAMQEADRLISQKTVAMVDPSTVEGGAYRTAILRPTSDERAMAAEGELARQLTVNAELLKKNVTLKEAHDKMQAARREVIKKRMATSWKTQLLGLAMLFQVNVMVTSSMKPRAGSTFETNVTTLAQNILRRETEFADDAREFLTGTRSMPVGPDKTKMTREATDVERIIGILANEKISERERSGDLIDFIDGDYGSIPDAVARGDFNALSTEQRLLFRSILDDERAWLQDMIVNDRDGYGLRRDAYRELGDLTSAVLSLTHGIEVDRQTRINEI